MNVVKHHVNDFFKQLVISNCDYNLFINEANKYVRHYKSDIQKTIFLERIFMITKAKYDRHLKFCSKEDALKCRFKKYYEIVLFFLQSEIDDLERKISNKYFNKNTRLLLNSKLEYFIDSIDSSIFYDERDYIVFKNELIEMKNYYYLDKKSWRHLFLGKIFELQNKKNISRETSEKIIEQTDSLYYFRDKDFVSVV